MTITLENGETVEADVLIGADGIWSSIRSKMHDNPTKVLVCWCVRVCVIHERVRSVADTYTGANKDSCGKHI